MNVKTHDTTVKSKESRCSCDKCDSAYCFSKRNADITCSCYPCPVEKDTSSIKESSSHQNIPAGNVIVNNVCEAAPKDVDKTELDKYNEIENEHISREKAENKKPQMENKMSYVSIGRFTDEDSYISVAENTTPNIMKSILDPLSSHLAAQIMDLPCTDSHVRRYNKSAFQNTIFKYPNDIFKRIKDVYKACSCKVCECIAGKSMMDKRSCDCKPCVCNKCRYNGTMVTMAKKPSSEIYPFDDESCPCARCDRKEQCKGICSDKTKSAQPRICDCNPSRKNKYDFGKPCDCKPCQCIKCQVSSRVVRQTTLVVAPVEQNYIACDCSPCECSECVRSYRLSTEATTRHEMSTEINRHPHCQCESCVAEACVPDGNDSCWCVRQKKVMSKPFQKNSDEYDIRQAKLTCKFKQTDTKKGQNTVAMFAEISNKFHKKTLFPKNCDCGFCQCIVCQKKENTESINIPERECEKNHNNHSANRRLSPNIEKKSTCEFYDCINCESLKYDKGNPIRSHLKTSYSKSVHNCKKSISKECHKPRRDNTQLIEKRENTHIKFLQTLVHTVPAYTYKNTVNSIIAHHGDANYSVETSLNTSVANPTKATPHEVHVNGIGPQCSDQINTQLQEDDFERILKVHNTNKKEEIRPFDTTNDPSFNSFASFIKDSGSITPISRMKKSGESSLNSSGHDYENYLIHFPKTNVEEYIHDVMKTNFSPDVNYNMNKSLQIPTKDSNDKSIFNASNSSSFSPKHANESVSSKKTFDTEGRLSKANVWHKGETIRNTGQKKDSRQELIDAQNNYYKQTKRSIITPLTENYQQIQDTLKEAREFSQQLVKLLQKYEDANKQFDSASNKFKMSNFSINQQESLKECDETAKYGSYKNKHLDNIAVLPSIAKDDKNNKISGDKNRGKKLITNNPSKSIPETQQSQNAPAENNKETANNNFNSEMNLNRKETSVFTDPFFNVKIVANVNNQTDQDVGVNNVKEVLGKERTSQNIRSDNTELKEKQVEKKKKNKGYKYIYKRTITSSKKMKISPKDMDVKYDASIVTEESSSQQGQTVTNKQAIHVSKSMIGINESKNVDITRKPTSYKLSETNSYDQEPKKSGPNIVVIKSPEDDDTIGSPKIDSTVTTKTNYRETENNVRSKQNVVPTLPTLEIEIKDAIRMFSLKPNDVASNVTWPIRVENETPVIQSEAKKLMDSKVFQPFIGNNNKSDTKANEELCHVNVSKSTPNNGDNREKDHKLLYQSCSRHREIPADKYNNLQVNYVCLRKVSDHTVFVKWNAPEDLERVQGYEILVDGRLVHKTYNATKCMAVVTCLPASQKTLLTVRTVPNVPDVQRMLATTIVYRPRKNK